ncbi:MAG: hypothetical protein JWO09_2742 [Bacteroidetes bacterium]|nr:hypothetical protein [Bacteroidota bacterium]
MKIGRLLIITVLILYISPASAAGVWENASKKEVMDKFRNALDWFTKTGAYKVNVSYASFVDHTTAVPYERSEGSFVKDGKNLHSVVLGMHTIQNERYRITVSDDEQMIALNNLSGTEQLPVDMESFSDLLDHVQAIRKQVKAGGTCYRIEFAPNGLYASFEFELDAAGLLGKLTYFYSAEMTEENDEADESGNVNKGKIQGKPRMEISFYNYQQNLKVDYEKEFSEKKYFTASGKKVTLSEKYRHYELKDYRYDLK